MGAMNDTAVPANSNVTYTAQRFFEAVLRDGTPIEDVVAALEQELGAVDLEEAVAATHIDLSVDYATEEPTLAVMLAKIPEGWGADLRCHRGWWPLVGAMDSILSDALGPYEIYQVKSKFGGLRYYWGPMFDRRPGMPLRYLNGVDLTSDEFGDTWAQLRPVIDQFVHKGEAYAATLCERCGESGVLMCRSGGSWLTTLCPACADGMHVPVTPSGAEGAPGSAGL